ncbi:MAG: AraC family transcriptional regulator [Cytophagales bacterium]|uniref:Helix-turn-helix domain-containing protein n=1 Tax=Algoriphagus taiwanensis TaxID=1445656 RepID=A0ABQ6PXU6_9BACT|nr:MAG: AraC family transcriptional regulator [Cytophagales bacterium]GMQ32130.1 helix-turn-helix domain-containing protein [Algoriphagus taiwanensis]
MYHSSLPSEAASGLVTFFYQMKMAPMITGELGELLMPSGTGILGIHLQGRYQVNGFYSYDGPLPEYYLVGQQTRSYRLKVENEEADIFGIAIRPTAIWRLTKRPAIQFTDRPTPLEEVFAEAWLDTIKQIAEKPSFEKRVEKAEEFISEILSDLDLSKTLVDYALELIFEKKGCISTRELCKELHVSERHLQHLFRQQVGLSPLQYARITRFNSIFVEFTRAGESPDLPFLTSFFNYYDISHFFKDFKAYSGESPSQFHLERFSLLKELVANQPYLTQVQNIRK